MYAKRTTKTENLGQLRELYQQYDGTTANWAPRWVGGVVPGRSATPLVARGVVSQVCIPLLLLGVLRCVSVGGSWLGRINSI